MKKTLKVVTVISLVIILVCTFILITQNKTSYALEEKTNFEINKVDQNNNKIKGAEFSIYGKPKATIVFPIRLLKRIEKAGDIPDFIRSENVWDDFFESAIITVDDKEVFNLDFKQQSTYEQILYLTPGKHTIKEITVDKNPLSITGFTGQKWDDSCGKLTYLYGFSFYVLDEMVIDVSSGGSIEIESTKFSDKYVSINYSDLSDTSNYTLNITKQDKGYINISNTFIGSCYQLDNICYNNQTILIKNLIYGPEVPCVDVG